MIIIIAIPLSIYIGFILGRRSAFKQIENQWNKDHFEPHPIDY